MEVYSLLSRIPRFAPARRSAGPHGRATRLGSRRAWGAVVPRRMAVRSRLVERKGSDAREVGAAGQGEEEPVGHREQTVRPLSVPPGQLPQISVVIRDEQIPGEDVVLSLVVRVDVTDHAPEALVGRAPLQEATVDALTGLPMVDGHDVAPVLLFSTRLRAHTSGAASIVVAVGFRVAPGPVAPRGDAVGLPRDTAGAHQLYLNVLFLMAVDGLLTVLPVQVVGEAEETLVVARLTPLQGKDTALFIPLEGTRPSEEGALLIDVLSPDAVGSLLGRSACGSEGPVPVNVR